jgi:phage baseplate assembly protein V
MGRKNILADSDFTAGKDNRYGNSLVIGRVSKIECSETAANVRVIFPDKLDHKGNPLITKPVPILHTAAAGKKSFQIPRVGTNVALMKYPNSHSDYAVIGSFYTTSDPPPVTDPMLDHTVYDDGSVMQFDASKGQLDWNLKGDYNYKGEKAVNILVKGNVTIKPEGDILLEAPNIELKGAMKFTGDIDHQGAITTSKTHRDSIGGHSGGRTTEELEQRIAALEARVLALEQRHGS